MPLIEVHLIEKTRSSGPPHHRHVLGGAATAMTEGEGVSLMNPNKTLWEKGDYTRIAQSVRESGEELVNGLGITKGLKVLDLGPAMEPRHYQRPGSELTCWASISPRPRRGLSA